MLNNLNVLTLQISLATSLLALVYAYFLARNVLTHAEGSIELLKLSAAIKTGANTYIKRQTTIIFLVSLFLSLGLMYLFDFATAFGFLLGAGASATAGFLGMSIAVRSNNRTAQAARESIESALSLAFKGGTITGLLVVGLALGIVTLFYYLTNDLRALIGLGFGASLVSVFARIGGGIYTKGADVGADLAGKVEAGIPEDDPRNPAVIADNVGDNVGDCAGMAADLFETYAVTLISTILLGTLIFPANKEA